MKKLVIILGFISAVIAVLIAITPLSQMAFIPAIIALFLGIVAMYLSKQKQGSKKIIQLLFLLTIIALALTTYKSIFNTVEVGDTQELIDMEEESQEDAINELNDIEIEDIE